MRKREEGHDDGGGGAEPSSIIIAVLGIISFINIFAVHNKIQYALYQMTNELTSTRIFMKRWGCGPRIWG